MVEQVSSNSRNVIDFLGYKKVRDADSTTGSAPGASPGGPARLNKPGYLNKPGMGNFCRHCGAALMDGESDDDCSTAGASVAPPRVFYVD